MTAHLGPRADSRAYNVLVKLIVDGGEKHAADLRRACGGNLTPSEFQNTVLSRLQRLGFIRISETAAVVITGAGRCYIHPPAVVPEPERVIVPARYVAPMAPLAKRVRLLVIRDGAFDYRNVPSRHGDQRIAFKPGFLLDGATQE